MATTTLKSLYDSDSNFEFSNDIQRSDDYLSSHDDNENKKFFVLSKTDDEKINEKKSIVQESLPPRNLSLHTPSSPGLGNTARLEMLTDFFDVPSSPLMSASTLRPFIPKKGVVLAAKNYISSTNTTLTRHSVPVASFRHDGWVK